MSDFSIGKYTVVGPLGTGAHSSIVHIRRSADSKNYALKIVQLDTPADQKFFEQARNEYIVGQLLDHANLAKIYALETIKDWMFRVRKVHLLIEYVNGRTLDTCPPLRLPHHLQVFEHVASGLVHMHRRKVYHADLKPNNVMLSKAGEVKVIDFGLAWTKGVQKDRIQGTPEYIAPEQAKNKIVNERTDIYNFGAMMYRLLTSHLPPCVVPPEGGLPIDAKTWQRMLKPVQELNPKAPKPLCELVHRCISFNPAQRPERMSEVQGTLDHLAEDLAQAPEDQLENLEW